MLVSWNIAGLENNLWLMPTANQNYPRSFFTNIDEYEKYGYRLYKVSYIEESNDYKVEYIYVGKYCGKFLLEECTSENDPMSYTEDSIPILCEKFDRIKALVKPLFDLLYEDDFIGDTDESYLTVGHCFYFNDECGWYFCRVRYICDDHLDCDCIEIAPDTGIEASSKWLSAFYDFFEKYQPKYIEPEFFDHIWQMFKSTKEKALNILLGKE